MERCRKIRYLSIFHCSNANCKEEWRKSSVGSAVREDICPLCMKSAVADRVVSDR